MKRGLQSASMRFVSIMALAFLGACGGQGDKPLAKAPVPVPAPISTSGTSDDAPDYWTAIFDYKIGQRHEGGFSHYTDTVGPQISEVRCQIRRAEYLQDLMTDLAYDILSKCVRSDATGKPL